MQIDFNPMPASGETLTAEAPPSGGPSAAGAASDGGVQAGTQVNGGDRSDSAGSRKGFRETMDDLLRAARSDETSDGGQATPEAAEAEAAQMQGLPLLEWADLPLVQPETKTLSDSLPGEPAQGVPDKGGSSVVPQVETPPAAMALKAAQTTMKTADPNGGHQQASVTPEGQSSPEGMKAAELRQVMAEGQGPLPADPKLRGASDQGSGSNGAAAAFSKTAQPADAKIAQSADSATQVMKTDPGPSTAGADLSAARGQAAGGAQIHPQTQDGADQRNAGPGEPAAFEKPAAVKEGQPQSFNNLVETLEKGGSGNRPMSVQVDLSPEAAGTSSVKSAPVPQSDGVQPAKADSAGAPAPLPPKEEVIRQIVDSAKLRLNHNGQNEIRIQLKPEHLGQVRLNISTDQHQVMVKVVAELPAVKELLETHLPQLRSELSGQGLEIDKFSVSVGGDAESQNKEQQTWGQHRSGSRSGDRGGSFTQADGEHQDGASGSESRRQPLTDRITEGVDYFA
jgi:flagellar hook-length control protein FliK